MAERVGDIFPVTCLQLELQAYRLITVVRYTGVTAGQNTINLPCAYCIEIPRTRESMIILSIHLNLCRTTFIDEVISRIKCTEQTHV